MELNDRIKSLGEWGEKIGEIRTHELNDLFLKVRSKNGWFTEESCSHSLSEIRNWLIADRLESWTKRYQIKGGRHEKTIGLVMAGNIPLVGFHDLLSVLVSGHFAKIKLSSQDDELLPFLTNLLFELNSEWTKSVQYADRLNDIDAVIATGSDNSARYFENYFKSIPRIIRKNRTSIAVIMGDEGIDVLKMLADDIFTYFGMGCRNVSKILIPYDFEIGILGEPFSHYKKIMDHHKYANNYDYQKSIRIISSKAFHDTGFLLLEESEGLVSPISVTYYEYYNDQEMLTQLLNKHTEKIQCIVSANGWLKGSIPFGQAQQPGLNDYADGVDTLKFLLSL